MKPEKLTISGWGPYKDLVEIDFTKFEGQGLFLITGATGAGKTTIFDAVTYALYGALSGEIRDRERDSVRSDFADPDTPTYVELQMIHKGKAYLIRRNPEYLRPKKRSGGKTAYTKEKENAVLRVEDTVIEGVKEVNAFLKEVLALDYTQFKQLSMIAQGEFAKLLNAPPRDKTRIFREIFGTGVYERFTASLSTRAKKQYQVIMEQRHKLEELVRILEEPMRLSGFSEEDKKEFSGLTAAENLNFERLETFLKEKKKTAKGMWEAAEKGFAAAETALTQKREELTRKQGENRQIQEYLNAAAQQKLLEENAEEIVAKEIRLQRAANAGWVEAGEVRLLHAKNQMETSAREYETLEGEILSNRQKLESLQPIGDRKEQIAAFIRLRMELEQVRKQRADLEQKLQRAEGQEQDRKRDYLEAEQKSETLKREYEAALKIQRRTAIGIAAGMLQEGVPCPVCGSLEHPAPARQEEVILSEEELEAMKAGWEESEKLSRNAYNGVVEIQTLIKNLQEQAEICGKHAEEGEDSLKQQLAGEQGELFLNFYSQKPEESQRKLQKILEDIQKMQAILQEKENRRKQLGQVLEQLAEEQKQAESAFDALLVQYGFETPESYRQACLQKAERDRLSREVEDYRNKVISNRELLEHLKQRISAREVLDLQPLEAVIGEIVGEKNRFLQDSSSWKQLYGELERTLKGLREKRTLLEKQNLEYGRIRELENIASGNNAKKLVFEQYVLAGYFEEILKAANIRFRKMTSGRYEMHRTQEVGDGRTKDNLEIQVMDYYTGRHRSVRTLSGGESFKASLSLALGLSDVMQSMSGGIRVEALFIDEGFGALDSESLDQACETLLSLVESDRIIGIISHVPELRERISRQIIIDKQGNGSTLRMQV